MAFNIEENKWRKLWKLSKGDVYQSWEWANIKKISGKSPIFVTFSENNDIKAGILAFEYDLIIPLLGRKKILIAEGTPLFLNEGFKVKILEAFKKESKKYFYSLVVPSYNFTIMIDLSKTKDELWTSLEKKSARWGIKVAERNNLLFEEAKNLDEVKKFYKIYKSIENEKFKPKPFEFLEGLFKYKDIARLFFIKKNKRIIAGGAILIDNNCVILGLTASTEEGYKSQAMPFLYWNLILFSKSLGKQYFDLGGYDMESKQGEKTFNINKFKENFGGALIEMPVFFTNWKYNLARALLRKFRFIKKLYLKK